MWCYRSAVSFMYSCVLRVSQNIEFTQQRKWNNSSAPCVIREPFLLQLTIQAQDRGQPPLSSNDLVTVELRNIDDNRPTFTEVRSLHVNRKYPNAVGSVRRVRYRTGYWRVGGKRLALCQYIWPQYMHRGENHLKQNRFRNARHDLPHPACTFVCHIERFTVTITTPLRQWKHTRKHSSLFGDDNGQYFV